MNVKFHKNCEKTGKILKISCVREDTFLLGGGGGGWTRASEGIRVLSKVFTNWGGSNLFYSQPGEGHSFFGKEKNYSKSLLFCIYTSKAASQD